MPFTQTQSDAITDAIADVAANPAEISTSAGSVKEHKVGDLLEAQKAAAASAAVGSNTKTRGVIFNKISHKSTQG